MHLVDDLAIPTHTAPAAVAPREAACIDYLRWTMRPLGLKARRRIRIKVRIVVESKTVARPRSRAVDEAGEEAIRFPSQFVTRRRLLVEHDLDTLAFGRPDS